MEKFTIVLLHPEIPQNTGAIARTCACFSANLALIEPLGFVYSPQKLKRAGMDYLDFVNVSLYASLEEYCKANPSRLILFTTKSQQFAHNFRFELGDSLVFGNESSGAAECYHAQAFARVKLPISPTARSLNLATSVALGLYEAQRQGESFPTL